MENHIICEQHDHVLEIQFARPNKKKRTHQCHVSGCTDRT